MNILVDMDGVICDWCGAACEAFGKNLDDVLNVQPAGHFGIEVGLGVSRDELWSRLDGIGEKFWSDKIKPYSWATQLYSACCKMAPTYFLTSPSIHAVSAGGKIKWLREFTGDHKFRDYVLTTHKHLLAKPSNVLIDDDDEKVASFRNAGGKAILFPQRWNARFDDFQKLGKLRYLDVLNELQGVLNENP
jgi:5'(3')-deoxyribonucleotidase